MYILINYDFLLSFIIFYNLNILYVVLSFFNFFDLTCFNKFF